MESIKMLFRPCLPIGRFPTGRTRILTILKWRCPLPCRKWRVSDKGCSGVLFTIDTESGFEKALIINGSWGLGNYCKGVVNPDEFRVFKPTLKKALRQLSIKN